MDDLQFYPTPPALAKRAWDMFQKEPERVLEPSAGNGDLLQPVVRNLRRRVKIDVIEIDPTKHPLLQSKDFNVVGFDFLAFQAVGLYSHIIMNPPFAQGAQHLLHAWQHLHDGEIVCILNAETLRNPFSRERQWLAGLIAKHGRVEYISDAFSQADRKTEVEIALVHMIKRSDADALVGDLISDLRQEKDPSFDFTVDNQLAIPQGFVEDVVLRFNAAAIAAKDLAKAQAVSAYYRRLLGKTMKMVDADREPDPGSSSKSEKEQAPQCARRDFAKAYDDLKDAAWTSILRSSDVLSRLSSSAREKVQSEFEQIKKLEFTEVNIYGFLNGICQAQGEIQMGMLLDVFDEISRYHEDNTVFYMGWKSNGRHRTAGMKVKARRFILPGFGTEAWQRNLGFVCLSRLGDFDRVFAMLDGKHESTTRGLKDIFTDSFNNLVRGERVSGDYFEVRYYRKRGTVHIFPKSQELVDRLNLWVGRQRQWLPPQDKDANADFHAQYQQAESFDSEFRSAFGGSSWTLSCALPFLRGVEAIDRGQNEITAEKIDKALNAVMKAHGWNPCAALSYSESEQMLLLAA